MLIYGGFNWLEEPLSLSNDSLDLLRKYADYEKRKVTHDDLICYVLARAKNRSSMTDTASQYDKNKRWQRGGAEGRVKFIKDLVEMIKIIGKSHSLNYTPLLPIGCQFIC